MVEWQQGGTTHPDRAAVELTDIPPRRNNWHMILENGTIVVGKRMGTAA